jgi:hypothetical protein
MQAHGLKPLLCMAAHARRGGMQRAGVKARGRACEQREHHHHGHCDNDDDHGWGAGHGRARQWQQQVIWHLVAAAAAPTTAMGVVVESVA